MELTIRIIFGAEDMEDQITKVKIAIFQGYKIVSIDFPTEGDPAMTYHLAKPRMRWVSHPS